ncbi:MAG: hypothetical protein AAGE98_07280 [Actinomycetota bacterium]
MSGSLLRIFRLAGLGALASLIAGLVRSTRPKPPPPASGVASWDPLVDEADAPTRSGPVQFTAGLDDTESADADEEPTEKISPLADLALDDEPEVDGAEAGDAATGWVEPDADGGCPGSHPIKGNDQSKIFHVPGGMSYERTKAERCYCDEASAEADGYRKAKR